MNQENRNILRGVETITEIMMILRKAKPQLFKLTREDINYLRGRLDLLEYLLAPKLGAKIEPYMKATTRACTVCGQHHGSIYQHLGIFFCPDHLPSGVTYPIGMHGEDFKAYQERKR